MKLIYSSIYGQLFGLPTKVSIRPNGVLLVVKNKATEIAWKNLTCPPRFSSTWLGKTIIFSTAGDNFILTNLAYSSEKKYKTYCEQLWIAENSSRLSTLLDQIDTVVTSRYLRQSQIKNIHLAIKKEYSKWFPWAKTSEALGDTTVLLNRLSEYHLWKKQQFILFREKFINKQLTNYKAFFDQIETNPLSARQRRACIIDDDNNLLLAGAGTGKTSVMVARAGYLINSRQANYNEILLLAYGRKAANEMDQRIKSKLQTDKISATTFHSLGLHIIAQVEGAKPKLSTFAEDDKAKGKWVQTCFEQLITEQQAYRHLVFEYFSQYYYVEKSAFEFANLGDYYQYLNDNDIRSLKGDQVKSFAELYIANWLFNHGIEYVYEASYEHSVQTAEQKQYKPNFYLPALNIYIEYHAVDENDETASYVDKDQYQQAIEWKRNIHHQHNTQCIELTYAQHKAGQLLETLEKYLDAEEIAYDRLPDQMILDYLKETGRITLLAELFAKLLGLYKSACLDQEQQKKVIIDSSDPLQTAKALQLLQPILLNYQAHLASSGEIDFEDMISNALNYIESGQFKSQWRYIMVDEFQDISQSRSRLVKALRDNQKGCSVFAVGDDWQAIYRFSGADVSLTTHFSTFFGATTQSELDLTFRFNNKIGQVATDFVSQNPAQINKKIQSLDQVNLPAVSLYQMSSTITESKIGTQNTINEVASGAIEQVLNSIVGKVEKQATVYLLARFAFQLPDKKTLSQLNSQYPLLNIETQTFHGSKGKEADYVVLMGLTSGPHGFPSEKVTPAILDALLAKQEDFKHAEERRLFYVALTRAKQRVYIIADIQESSYFVKELEHSGNVELNEFDITVKQSFVEQVNCLVCGTGTLKARNSNYGTFFSCSYFPRCDHKERACESCQSVMSRTRYKGFKTCLNTSCQKISPLCEKCGAEMVLRKSAKGEFWGCRNYKGKEQTSCRHAIDKSKVQWPQMNG